MMKEYRICIVCWLLLGLAGGRTVSAEIQIQTLSAAALQADPDAGQHNPNRNFGHADMLPIDDTAFALATQTGGDFYFWAPGEFSRSAETAGDFMAKHLVASRNLAYDTGELALDEVGEHYCDFSVTEGLETLTIFTGLQSRENILIEQPNGRRLQPGDNLDIEVIDLTYMRLAVIRRPLAGTWTVRIRGRGKFLVSVKAR